MENNIIPKLIRIGVANNKFIADKNLAWKECVCAKRQKLKIVMKLNYEIKDIQMIVYNCRMWIIKLIFMYKIPKVRKQRDAISEVIN